MGVWCNDSMNGSNPFGRGLNPLTPAKKIKKSALKFLYVKKLLYLCSRFVITTVLTANNDYVFRVAKVAVCKTDEVKLHVGSSPTIVTK